MRNIVAIADKELRSYFVSPIAYVVVGLFALLFGWFFVSSLSVMVRFSMQAGMFGMGGRRASTSTSSCCGRCSRTPPSSCCSSFPS